MTTCTLQSCWWWPSFTRKHRITHNVHWRFLPKFSKMEAVSPYFVLCATAMLRRRYWAHNN